MSISSIKNPTRGQMSPNSVIVAVGGGKGGIGKSFISSNIGIFLANMGFDTVVVDLDLGASNLHSCLGENPPSRNFHDFLAGKHANISEVAMTTKIPNLRLLSGANDHSELANISVLEQSRLMSALYKMDADFMILDLSAGTHTSTLDFFLMAQHHVITFTPDPTSIENAYRFMKAAYYRKIKRYERQLQLDSVVVELMSHAQENNIRIPSDLMTAIIKKEPTRGLQLRDIMSQLSFELVMNQTRGSKDVQLARSVESVCRKYFGLNINTLGHIEHDNAVWQALRKRRPLTLEYPSSAIYSQLLGIARDLASPHLKKAVI